METSHRGSATSPLTITTTKTTSTSKSVSHLPPLTVVLETPTLPKLPPRPPKATAQNSPDIAEFIHGHNVSRNSVDLEEKEASSAQGKSTLWIRITELEKENRALESKITELERLNDFLHIHNGEAGIWHNGSFFKLKGSSEGTLQYLLASFESRTQSQAKHLQAPPTSILLKPHNRQLETPPQSPSPLSTPEPRKPSLTGRYPKLKSKVAPQSNRDSAIVLSVGSSQVAPTKKQTPPSNATSTTTSSTTSSSRTHKSSIRSIFFPKKNKSKHLSSAAPTSTSTLPLPKRSVRFNVPSTHPASLQRHIGTDSSLSIPARQSSIQVFCENPETVKVSSTSVREDENTFAATGTDNDKNNIDNSTVEKKKKNTKKKAFFRPSGF